MPDQNPVHELIQVEKENQALLKELIELTKKRKHQERWKLILESIKMLLWPLIIALSLYFSVAAIKGFTGHMMDAMKPTSIIEQITNKGGQSSNVLEQSGTDADGSSYNQSLNLDAMSDLLKLLGN